MKYFAMVIALAVFAPHAKEACYWFGFSHSAGIAAMALSVGNERSGELDAASLNSVSAYIMRNHPDFKNVFIIGAVRLPMSDCNFKKDGKK